MQDGTDLTRARAAALAGALLTLVAFMFDASPLFICGVAFLVLGLGAPAWVWLSARGARAARWLPSERVVESEPLQATIEVRRGWLGLPGAEVLDPVSGARMSLRNPLALISGSRNARVRVVTSFARRGRHRLEPPTLLVSDPLELARTVRTGAGPVQDLLVLPRTERVQWRVSPASWRLDRGEGSTASDALAAVDMDGLRPYRPGTPASRIHWPAAARGAGLLERRLEPEGDTRPLIVLDTRGDGRNEPVDAAVRAAASLVLELARREGCGLLLSGERRATMIEPDLLAWPAVHARLALVEGGPAARAPALSSSGGRVGPVLYVAASALERLSSRVAGSTQGVAMLILPISELGDDGAAGPRMAGAPSLEVCGCLGFPVRGRRRAGSRAAA